MTSAKLRDWISMPWPMNRAVPRWKSTLIMGTPFALQTMFIYSSARCVKLPSATKFMRPSWRNQWRTNRAVPFTSTRVFWMLRTKKTSFPIRGARTARSYAILSEDCRNTSLWQCRCSALMWIHTAGWCLTILPPSMSIGDMITGPQDSEFPSVKNKTAGSKTGLQEQMPIPTLPSLPPWDAVCREL